MIEFYITKLTESPFSLITLFLELITTPGESLWTTWGHRQSPQLDQASAKTLRWHLQPSTFPGSRSCHAMGVHGLWKLVEPARKMHTLSEISMEYWRNSHSDFRGLKVGIGAFTLLCQIASWCLTHAQTRLW